VVEHVLNEIGHDSLLPRRLAVSEAPGPRDVPGDRSALRIGIERFRSGRRTAGPGSSFLCSSLARKVLTITIAPVDVGLAERHSFGASRQQLARQHPAVDEVDHGAVARPELAAVVLDEPGSQMRQEMPVRQRTRRTCRTR